MQRSIFLKLTALLRRVVFDWRKNRSPSSGPNLRREELTARFKNEPADGLNVSSETAEGPTVRMHVSGVRGNTPW